MRLGAAGEILAEGRRAGGGGRCINIKKKLLLIIERNSFIANEEHFTIFGKSMKSTFRDFEDFLRIFALEWRQSC